MGHGSLGLSCVLVQGLLFSGYAYRVSALRAIPGAPLQAEDHLRIAWNSMSSLGDLVPLSTDRHSLTIPQLVEISIPTAGDSESTPGIIVLPDITRLRVCASIPLSQGATHWTLGIHSSISFCRCAICFF